MDNTKTKVEELEFKNTLKTWALNIVFFIILFIPLMLFNGWCLSTIWNMWIPTVYDFKLTVIQAIGISFIIGWFTSSKINNDTKTLSTKEYWQKQITVIIGKLLCVGISSLVYMFLVK